MIKRAYNRNDLLGDLLSAGTAYGAGHLTTMSGVGNAMGEYFADRERGGTGEEASEKVRSAMKDPTTVGAIGLRTGNILSNALNAPGGHGLATPITAYFMDVLLRRHGEKLFPGLEKNPYMRGSTAALASLGSRALMRGFDNLWDHLHKPAAPILGPSTTKTED